MIEPVVTSDTQTRLSRSGRFPVTVTSCPGSALAPGSAAVAIIAGHNMKPAATIGTHRFLSIVPPPDSRSDRPAPFTINLRRAEWPFGDGLLTMFDESR